MTYKVVCLRKTMYSKDLEEGRKNRYVNDKNEDEGFDMDCVDYICQIPDFAK